MAVFMGDYVLPIWRVGKALQETGARKTHNAEPTDDRKKTGPPLPYIWNKLEENPENHLNDPENIWF